MCAVLGHGHGHSHGGGGHGHSHGGGGHGHSHGGHGHSHNKRKRHSLEGGSSDSTGRLAHVKDRLKRKKKKQNSSENINVRAAFVHVIGDLIQSIGVIIAGYIIWFRVSAMEAMQPPRMDMYAELFVYV